MATTSPGFKPRGKPLHDVVRGGKEGGIVTATHQGRDDLVRMHALASGMLSCLKTPATTIPSASARLSTSSRSKTFLRSVLERGSSTAQSLCPGYAGAQGFQRFSNGGRVMGKIVDDRDPRGNGAHFESALHAEKCRERFRDGSRIDSLSHRQRSRRGGVERVVLAGQRQAHLQPFFS